MIICKVQGKMISTIKNEKLEGYSFVIVQQVDKKGKMLEHPLVAIDEIGCGIGDIVLVTKGANSRYAFKSYEIPIDTVIVGIVNSYNIEKIEENKKGGKSK